MQTIRQELKEKIKELIVSTLNLELSPAEIQSKAALFGAGFSLDSVDATKIADQTKCYELWHKDFVARIVKINSSSTPLNPQDIQKHIRIKSRSFELALEVIRETLLNSSLDDTQLKNYSVGLYVATSHTGTDVLEDFYADFLTNNRTKNLHRLQTGDFSLLADNLQPEFDITGPVRIIANTCSSGTFAFDLALRDLHTKKINYAIIAGVVPITKQSITGFSSLNTFAEKYPKPIRAKDAGLAIGKCEGCIFLVCEERPTIDKIYMQGVAFSADGYHATAPVPHQGSGAMQTNELYGVY